MANGQKLKFPNPKVKVNNRNYWDETELEMWERDPTHGGVEA
jgi:hypothetical protein